MRNALLFLAGVWVGTGVGVLLVLLLASGAPRHPEGKTWQRGRKP